MKSAQESAHLSHDLVLVCPHLGDGGVQRVVSTLANAWAEQGRRVAVVALYRDEISYGLEPGVTYVSLSDWEETGVLLRLIESTRRAIERTRLGFRHLREFTWLRIKRLAGAVAATVVQLTLWVADRLEAWLGPREPSDSIFAKITRLVRRIAGWLSVRRPAASLRTLVKQLVHLVQEGISFFYGELVKPFVRLWRRIPHRFIWRIYPPIAARVAALRKAIRMLGAPTVVAFCGSTNVATILATRHMRKRVIISERNDPAVQILNFPWNDLRPTYYGRASKVTANSTGALQTMSAYVSKRKLALVPNPVVSRGNEYEARVPSISDAPTVLIVARLHFQKAHDILLEAFAHALPDLPEWRLSIVGRGPAEPALRDLAQELGIEEHVDWHGYAYDPYPYYQRAAIFALPSRHEGMPNALLEAMSCGLPVIVTDASPGPLEFVENDQTGVVVAAEDPLALSRALKRLALDTDLAQSLGRAARERVACLSLSSTLDVWEGLIG